MNPYQSHSEVDRDGKESDSSLARSSNASLLAYSVWGIGTFLFSFLVLIDSLIGARISGRMIVVAFVLGPTLGVCGAIATHHRLPSKLFMIITTLCLLPIQFIIVGIVLLAIDGLKGVQ